ncbi:ribonuclease kappa-B-like isoform X2 [Actinia tenebrosa]|uniref:Ribonuclease kappa-B-like isoform X2 n=2 Tax=Actinia tenebrosa TaxID=6105 RepID=A0A6P8J0G2_ACTTE|nr:ribonuclease kappa-B-like isoform X2 [Actinia tenebrosa]
MLRICGPKLSNCCFILSLWGVIMLVLLGIFFQTRSVALLEDISKDSKEEAAFSSSAKNCFIGAGIYGVTLIISIHQKWLNARTGDTQKLVVA